MTSEDNAGSNQLLLMLRIVPADDGEHWYPEREEIEEISVHLDGVFGRGNYKALVHFGVTRWHLEHGGDTRFFNVASLEDVKGIT